MEDVQQGVGLTGQVLQLVDGVGTTSGSGDGSADDEPVRGTTDEELARRFTTGDRDAVGAIYDEFAGPVWSVAFAVLGDRSLADDTVQETFVRAWRAASSFDPAKPFGPWLFTIARRTAIDVLRREMRPTRGDHAPERDVVVEMPGIEVSWQRWEVRHALSLMGDDERELLHLLYFRGLTQSEVAQSLGIALGTVKSRSHRAHRRLAALLRHVVEDEESPAERAAASGRSGR